MTFFHLWFKTHLKEVTYSHQQWVLWADSPIASWKVIFRSFLFMSQQLGSVSMMCCGKVSMVEDKYSNSPCLTNRSKTGVVQKPQDFSLHYSVGWLCSARGVFCSMWSLVHLCSWVDLPGARMSKTASHSPESLPTQAISLPNTSQIKLSLGGNYSRA